MEGILKKKCMVVVWTGTNHTIVVPKLFKYIVRYFFISGSCLCYTKTKKDRDIQKPYKVLVDLTDVVALHVFETKMEVVVEGGKHIVLKSNVSDVKRWVPALAARLLPKMDSIVAHIPPPIPPIPQTESPCTPPPSRYSISSPIGFPFATTEHPPTPPYNTPHPLLNKLPSFRSQSSLSFTLTSKQRANWFAANFDEGRIHPSFVLSFSLRSSSQLFQSFVPWTLSDTHEIPNRHPTMDRQFESWDGTIGRTSSTSFNVMRKSASIWLDWIGLDCIGLDWIGLNVCSGDL